MLDPTASRRVAAARATLINRGLLPADQQVKLGLACMEADTYDDLPDWVHDLVEQAEAGAQAGEEDS